MAVVAEGRLVEELCDTDVPPVLLLLLLLLLVLELVGPLSQTPVHHHGSREKNCVVIFFRHTFRMHGNCMIFDTFPTFHQRVS